MPALDCPEELALIERGLRHHDGLLGIRPDYLQRTLHVEFAPERLDAESIAGAIRKIGFEVEYRQRQGTPTSAWARQGRWISLGLAALLLALAAGLWFVECQSTPAVIVLAVASTVAAGHQVARAGWRAVRLRTLDMNALMTIAASGALLTGDYFEAATAMLLFGISLVLESLSLDRARHAVQTLIELSPGVAHRLVGEGTDEIAPAEVVVGDRLLVKPGERLPADGSVESGHSTVNQAPITGESVPVEKGPNDEVFAGSLNGQGSLVVQATKAADESVLAQIRRLVEQAQASRSPTERFVDAFARRYTPAVIALAVVLAVVPPTLGMLGAWPTAWETPAWLPWLHRGLVLLVIACPCALVISTPITIVCGLYQAARRGILIKGGEHLESAAAIAQIVLDKTGTLTRGTPEVVEVALCDGRSEQDVLQIAASLERHSAHPLASGIVAAAIERQIELLAPQEFVAHDGLGISGRLNGHTFFVGNPRFFAAQELAGVTERDLDSQHGPTGSAQILVGTRDELWGTLFLADELRPEAVAALQQLRDQTNVRLTMLTGDSWSVARQAASRAGIDDVQAEMLPQQKVAAVETLALRHPDLAMVGDGVNDAPALAAARLGIAFGSGASATALETADVVIMSSSLRRIPELLSLGRRCRTLLRQNIGFALAVKAGVLALATVGMATMWMAVAADVGASLIVIFNGMRLIGYRGPQGNAESDA